MFFEKPEQAWKMYSRNDPVGVRSFIKNIDNEKWAVDTNLFITHQGANG